MSEYKFVPRKTPRDKYQVRFWAEDKKLYLEFKKRAEAKGMLVQDVFNQFMEQFK